MKLLKKTLLLSSLVAGSAFLVSCDDDDDVTTTTPAQPQARNVRIDFQSNGPVGFAPMLFAAHDGTFDFFTTGSTASSELETMAEVGNVGPLQGTVPAGGNSVASTGPTAPGSSFSLNLTVDSSNTYFSFAGMALPSSDVFIGNGNPQAFNLPQLLDANNGVVTIQVSRMYDAGTEVNDFLTAPGGALVGAPTGTPENGVAENANITLIDTNNHFDSYLNPNGPGAAANFNPSNLNPRGANVATITITQLP